MYAPSPKASSSTPTRAQPSIKPQRRPKQQQPLTSTPSTANTASSSTTLGTGQYANREPPPHLQPTNSKSRSSAVPASTSASSYSHGNLGQVHGQAGTGPSKVVMEKWMRDAGLEDVLEDLSSRFILNLPEEELASPERICFQVEQAHWFYEDFIRTTHPHLPSFNLKSFSSLFFLSCPLLSHWLTPAPGMNGTDNDGDDGGLALGGGYEALWERFMKYKNRVPVCGGILLDEGCQSCVLVKGWKSSASWGFPKGKINDEEEKWQCAVREVHEEIGYDITHLLNPDDFIEVTMNDQRMTLFIVCDVPRDARFETQTRKEISAIEWVKLTDLPTWRKQKQKVTGKKFYSVAPFVAPLKQWIKLHRGQSTRRDPTGVLQPDYNLADDESDGLTPIPSAAQPVSIDTQLRSDGTTSSAKIEIEMGDPAIATHISAGATSEGIAAAVREAKKNDRGETIDSLFSRFLGESSAGRGMAAHSSSPKTSGPATESQSADQAAHATSQGNAMQALLAKLATPATSSTLPPTANVGSPIPQPLPTSMYAVSSASAAQMQTSPSQAHARSLLSMLSPKVTPAAPALSAPVHQQGFPPQPNFASHPAAPAQSSTSAGDKETRRKALLDNMMAGLGPITSPTPAHAPASNAQYMSPRQAAHPPFAQAPQPMFGQSSQPIALIPQMMSGPPVYPYPQQRPPQLPVHNVPPHSAGPHHMPPSGAQWRMPGPPSPMVPFNGIAPPPAFSGNNMPMPPHFMPPVQNQGGHSQHLLNQLLAGPPPALAPKPPQGAGDLLNVLLGTRPTG